MACYYSSRWAINKLLKINPASCYCTPDSAASSAGCYCCTFCCVAYCPSLSWSAPPHLCSLRPCCHRRRQHFPRLGWTSIRSRALCSRTWSTPPWRWPFWGSFSIQSHRRSDCICFCNHWSFLIHFPLPLTSKEARPLWLLHLTKYCCLHTTRNSVNSWTCNRLLSP